MSTEQVYKNHIGLAIDVQVVDDDTGEAIDVSGLTTKQFKIKPPSGTTLTKATGFITDGTDGYLRYTTVDSDLDSVGTWQLQVYGSDGTEYFYTSIVTFQVLDTL